MSNEGKLVRVHYRGYLDDGTEFDSSIARNEPLEFTCGAQMVILGFDIAVASMEVGEKKTVHLDQHEAYGPYMEEHIEVIPKEYIPNAESLEVGRSLFYSSEEGFQEFKILEITDTEVKLDANHPLAGKDLNFEIELLDVTEF